MQSTANASDICGIVLMVLPFSANNCVSRVFPFCTSFSQRSIFPPEPPRNAHCITSKSPAKPSRPAKQTTSIQPRVRCAFQIYVLLARRPFFVAPSNHPLLWPQLTWPQLEHPRFSLVRENKSPSAKAAVRKGVYVRFARCKGLAPGRFQFGR